MINEDILDTMVRTAIDAMRNAYTEHGARAVGACVLASDGTLYTGCTVDNASPQLVMNAEAVAIARAVADGKREFDAMVIASDTKKPYVPCGTSCQLMAEFDVQEIIMADTQGNVEKVELPELLPYAAKRKELLGKEKVPSFRFEIDDENF